MLTKIKRLFRPKHTKIENHLSVPDMAHPFFGVLVSCANGSDDDFWQGTMYCEQVSDEISMTVNASYDGPSDKHVDFYNEFFRNYQTELSQLSKHLVAEYEKRHQTLLEKDFQECFLLSGITIPKEGNRENRWDISFECFIEPQHEYTLVFHKNQLVEIVVA